MTMQWEDISEPSRQVMKALGNFGPTLLAKNMEVKGYMLDENGDGGKAYFTAEELRAIASGCLEVAEWLERRAEQQI